MTCIVGLVEDGDIYMGADSASVGGGFGLNIRQENKVFIKDKFIFGFTSSWRMGNLLHHSLAIPRQYVDGDLYKYMCVDFIDIVRKCFKDGGYLRKKNEEESGGCFLVGTQGRLFYVGSDFQVGEVCDPWDATGCGEDIALGSLYSTQGDDPKVRIKIALEAAERYSAGVRRPFHIKKLKG